MGIGNFDICKEEACVFLKAAEWCCKDIDEFFGGMMYVGVVNAAFSCELGMKAIMIYNSSNEEFLKGHKLDKLYDCLPDEIQKDIKKRYNNHPNLPELQTFLSEFGDAFEKWRYAFEDGVGINVTAIMELANAINDCLKELK